MKAKNEFIESILNEAIAYFNIDESQLNKCNLEKLDYGHRVRYEKDESGNIISKIMDRGFIGLLKSKIGLKVDSDIEQNKLVNCFIYGKRTVGFYIDAGCVYANQNLIESSDFLCLCYNVINTQGLQFGGWVELPTGEVKRGSKPTDLASCIANAKTLENLGSDLGF